MNFVHFPIYSVSLLFLPFNQLPFPHSFSYFSYLWINSNSPIHFPTFQWGPHSPIPFPTFSTFQRAPIPESIFQPFNHLPFPHLFSYFCYLSMSSHFAFIFLLFLSFNELPFRHSFSYFSYLSMSSHSPIHFPGFSTFYWAPIPLFIFLLFLPYLSISSLSPFIFLLFLPFNELRPFPHLFSYFSYLSISSHSPICFPTIKWVPIPPFIFLFFLPFNELLFPHFFHTFLIFQSSSVPPFSFSYFSFTIFAFSYLAVVGKGGNRAKRPLELGIGLGLAPIVIPNPTALAYLSAF